MGRLVEHDATGPRRLDESDIDPDKGDIAVCQCGLSEEFPFCDGSHSRTSSEERDTWYRYGNDRDDGIDGDQPPKRVDRLVFLDGTFEEFENSSE